MLFRTAAIALLACVSSVAAEEAQPYKLVSGPVLGISLSRRTTPGYQPEQSHCGKGNTCAEACGTGYDTCPSNDGNTHCFNPTVKQSCCMDGTGNSCDDGYYCTHDTKAQTWCCPNSMDLTKCAAAYNVDGALATNALITTSSKPTTTSSSIKTSTTAAASTTKAVTTSTPKAVTTSSIKKSSTPIAVKTTVKGVTTTVCPTPTPTGYKTWSGSNSTVSTGAPTKQTTTAGSSGSSTTTKSAPVATGAAATTTGASALLLVVAGLFALL